MLWPGASVASSILLMQLFLATWSVSAGLGYPELLGGCLERAAASPVLRYLETFPASPGLVSAASEILRCRVAVSAGDRATEFTEQCPCRAGGQYLRLGEGVLAACALKRERNFSKCLDPIGICLCLGSSEIALTPSSRYFAFECCSSLVLGETS